MPDLTGKRQIPLLEAFRRAAQDWVAGSTSRALSARYRISRQTIQGLTQGEWRAKLEAGFFDDFIDTLVREGKFYRQVINGEVTAPPKRKPRRPAKGCSGGGRGYRKLSDFEVAVRADFATLGTRALAKKYNLPRERIRGIIALHGGLKSNRKGCAT